MTPEEQKEFKEKGFVFNTKYIELKDDEAAIVFTPTEEGVELVCCYPGPEDGPPTRESARFR